jgi:hypothetical protein
MEPPCKHKIRLMEIKKKNGIAYNIPRFILQHTVNKLHVRNRGSLFPWKNALDFKQLKLEAITN